ncbi:MAG TPA: HAD-IA family hydrolase [Paenalcaligenes sp.]|nr:HAD-IA family hydrolase [Paenalcaligenes sp.]
MRKYKAVIFDWDGTVMDSTYSITHSIQLASQDLGLPVPSREEASWIIGLSLETGLYRILPQLDEHTMPKFIERYRHHYFQRDTNLKLFDGMLELLNELKQQRILLSVATGKKRLGLDRALQATGLGPIFNATRCADETKSKPDPQMLHELLWELDIAPDEALMVGDTTHDIDMARNAGLDGLAVTYGAHDLRTLQQSEPVEIVHDVAQMHQWIGQRLC